MYTVLVLGQASQDREDLLSSNKEIIKLTKMMIPNSLKGKPNKELNILSKGLKNTKKGNSTIF